MEGGTNQNAYGVVYGRCDHLKCSIMLYDLQSRQSRRLYSCAGIVYSIPDDLGWLPSPDGRWLYVWDVLRDKHGARATTRLLLVRMADATIVPIGELKGEERVLPTWADAENLRLESPKDSAFYSVKERQLSGPLPRWAPPAPTPPRSISAKDDRVWREALTRLCGERYPRERECVRDALRELGDKLDLGIYLKEHPSLSFSPMPDSMEYFFLRSLGTVVIPDPAKRLYPTVVCSPEGSLLAACYLSTLPLEQKGEHEKWQPAWQVHANVSVFDLRSKDLVWGTTMTWPGLKNEHFDPQRPITYNPDFLQPCFEHLRWSTDARYLSFTAAGLPPLPGLPLARTRAEAEKRTRVEWGDREGQIAPTSAVIVADASDWYGARESRPREWHYLYIPDAMNAYVIPLSQSQ